MPTNYRWAVWGWPNRFLNRMRRADVQVWLVGPLGGEEPFVSEAAQLDSVPKGFGGMIVTDHIEEIGPEVRKRWPSSQQIAAREQQALTGEMDR